MASNYPGSLDSFDTIASDKKTSDSVGGRTHRQMHNDLGDAIESVQTELGTNPSGSDATVAARLSAIEAGTNLATGAVTAAKIADDTITAAQIAANAVGASELADNAVDTAAIADGAVTAVKILIGAATFGSGTGTPEGIVTAAPGSTWLQTDSTTDVKGWIRWVKATGTGNTGWVAGPEADTGWRDVTASLINGWVAAPGPNGALWLRRQGDRVTLLLAGSYGLDATSKTSNVFFTPPTGFTVPSVSTTGGYGGYGMLGTVWNTTTALAVQKNGSDVQIQGASTSYTRISGAVSWHCTATWPSSLPGSAT